MYEARQNKEKVSRWIDGGGMTKQRVKINKAFFLQPVHSNDKAIQRKKRITLTTSLGSFEGESAYRTTLSSFSAEKFPLFMEWWNENVNSLLINKRKRDVTGKVQGGKKGTREIEWWENRPPYQCAEPDALGKFLEAVKDKPQEFDPNGNFHFDSCAYENGFYEYPCAVCKQWVGMAHRNKEAQIELKNRPFMNELRRDIENLKNPRRKVPTSVRSPYPKSSGATWATLKI